MSDVPPRIDPASVRSAQFQGSFRKYDSKAVDQYHAALADQLVKVNAYIEELERKAASASRVAATNEAEPTEATPVPKPDLQTLSDDEIATMVGEETGHVLATARRAAEEIRTKAEEAAARMIRESTDEAASVTERAAADAEELRREAEGVRDVAVAKADTEAQEILDRAAADADRRVTEARAMADEELVRAERLRVEADEEAERIRSEAREEGRAMLAEAKDVRSRILEDLQHRRDRGLAQIERLVVGRDRLLEAYAVVRDNVDEMTAELEHVLDEPFEHDPALEEGFVGIVATAAPIVEELLPDDSTVESEPDVDEVVPADPIASEPDPDVAEPAGPVEELEPETAAADGSAPADGDTEPSADAEVDVDDLFARMRADREDSVARAQAVLSSAADEDSDARADDGSASEAEAQVEPEVEPEVTGTPGVDAVPAEYLASGRGYEHRTEVLAGANKALSRSLKRLLADEQNEVLDAVRRTESTALDDVLPTAEDHVGSYAEVAATTLAEVALSAAMTIDPDVSTVDVSDLAGELGIALVEPLRRRIERAATDVDGDHEELDERLRSLYREWKVEQIGRLASDSLISAYALGKVAAAPSGASVRWLIDPATGPCPDCQDNALEGPIALGDVFPTGDRRPQAHPGCSCMLDVVDAE